MVCRFCFKEGFKTYSAVRSHVRHCKVRQAFRCPAVQAWQTWEIKRREVERREAILASNAG